MGTEVDEEDDTLAAARWGLAIEDGLGPDEAEAFHAWLAADPARAELMAQQAALQSLVSQAHAHGVATRRRVLTGGMVVGGAVALGGAGLVVRAPWLDETGAYRTTTGEVRAIQLSDTSRLWLDARTSVSTRLTRTSREVTLDAGRMFVEVAPAPMRPFIVRGAQFAARALGTAFEATVFATRTGVAVTHGVVRLKPRAGPSLDLAAGDAAWIAGTGPVTRVSAPPPAIAAWRERRMVVADRRLDEALAELNRYFDRPLRVIDPRLAARRVSFSLSLAETDAEGAARFIAEVVDARVIHGGDAGILLGPSAPTGAGARLRG